MFLEPMVVSGPITGQSGENMLGTKLTLNGRIFGTRSELYNLSNAFMAANMTRLCRVWKRCPLRQQISSLSSSSLVCCLCMTMACSRGKREGYRVLHHQRPKPVIEDTSLPECFARSSVSTEGAYRRISNSPGPGSDMSSMSTLVETLPGAS